jgi:hypothetical protein
MRKPLRTCDSEEECFDFTAQALNNPVCGSLSGWASNSRIHRFLEAEKDGGM